MAKSFSSLVMAAARAGARASRQAAAERKRQIRANERYQKQQLRESIRYEKENLKYEKQLEKQRREQYIKDMVDEAEEATEKSNNLFNYLTSGIIKETLEIDDTVVFDNLKPKYKPPRFKSKLSDNLIPLATEMPVENTYIEKAGKMPFLGRYIGFIKKKWEVKIEKAKEKYTEDYSNWNLSVTQIEDLKRQLTIDIAIEKEEFNSTVEQYKKDYHEKCEEINDFQKLYFEGDEDAVISYASIVLENSNYLEDWEREIKIGYSKDSKEILVEFKLPTLTIIPEELDFKYSKTKDDLIIKKRKPSEISQAYSMLIASLALRTIHEIAESDQANKILIISFNGFVEHLNPSNGKTEFPTILSLTTSKEKFLEIKLDKIDPIKCIKGLSANVSSSPSEFVPVKPIREFSMIDKRFVEEENAISLLDTRPNLMDLNPFEFENLVSNLFGKMGLETKQTRTTKDGGVDAIAFDTRPVLGGKLVIQAKRYKNTVGVSAVRDLYGTMINEGASKGILVSTSSYGTDAFEFSKDKPIELIDGRGLLYLLDEVGVKAKIIMPS
ncbi:restriction endonuclease [Emticicia sp. BO119]|uniref:restriction endonuclease n=1 Tax=Emticicia sp. BO119 TaxID=2757768 RepID=UPI0015F05AA5|nr:restriction endonuclease [Emticicia sp. BO119]MBA4850247.1 restriction endonuclease [Emticicia sp. BO119]